MQIFMFWDLKVYILYIKKLSRIQVPGTAFILLKTCLS